MFDVVALTQSSEWTQLDLCLISTIQLLAWTSPMPIMLNQFTPTQSLESERQSHTLTFSQTTETINLGAWHQPAIMAVLFCSTLKRSTQETFVAADAQALMICVTTSDVWENLLLWAILQMPPATHVEFIKLWQIVCPHSVEGKDKQAHFSDKKFGA